MKKIISMLLVCLLMFGAVPIVDCSISVSAATVSLTKPKISASASSKNKTITIKWNKVINAKRYVLSIGVNGKFTSKNIDSSKTSYTYSVKDDGVYKFFVKAVNGTAQKKSGTITKTIAWYSKGVNFLEDSTFKLNGKKVTLPQTQIEFVKGNTNPEAVKEMENYPLFTVGIIDVVNRIKEYHPISMDTNKISTNPIYIDCIQTKEFMPNFQDWIVQNVFVEIRKFDKKANKWIENQNNRFYFQQGITNNSTLEDCVSVLGEYNLTYFSEYGSQDYNSAEYDLKFYVWKKNGNSVIVGFNRYNQIFSIKCCVDVPMLKCHSESVENISLGAPLNDLINSVEADPRIGQLCSWYYHLEEDNALDNPDPKYIAFRDKVLWEVCGLTPDDYDSEH